MLKKSNAKLIIIMVFLILISFGIKGVYNFIEKDKTEQKQYKEIYEKCRIGDITYQVVCDKYGKSLKKRDTISTFGHITHSEDFDKLQFWLPFLTMLAASSLFFGLIEGGYFKNQLAMYVYKKSIKKVYFRTLKCALLIPIFLGIIFLISYVISGHFDYEYSISLSNYFNNFYNINNDCILQFIIFYFLTFILYGIIWVNIAICNAKYLKNFVSCSVLSFIEYNFLSLILRLLIDAKILSNNFTLKTILEYKNKSVIEIFIFVFILFLISSLIVHILYRNREGTLNSLNNK